MFRLSFEDLVLSRATSVGCEADLGAISVAWRQKVHGSDPKYEDIPEGSEAGELQRAIQMLVGWWLRYYNRLNEEDEKTLISDAGRARMSAKWFHHWLDERKHLPVSVLLEKGFTETVFAQRLRVALSRFDGQVQRLRFTTGDDGIIPSQNVGSKLGSSPARMADRLKSFTGLLQDLEIIDWAEGQPIRCGQNAEWLTESNKND